VGGVGKTRLALQIAAAVLPRYRDGAWLVELAPVRDPERVADAVASVFGVTATAGQSVEDTLVEFLRTKQMLLLLDNCEHLLDSVAGLVDRIERWCAGVVVMVTGREGLALDGEQILAVASLELPGKEADFDSVAGSDAVELFVQRGRRVHADFELTATNASEVAQVCRRLDGVPLAIELAAARVNAMTPAELARGLDHRFETLAGGRRGAVQRHQTLRAAIDWSYDLLNEPERRVLARLSVFAGGCNRESAEAVCGGDPIEPAGVFGLLTALVGRSLVVAEPGDPETRYRLLETIREYGEERLAQLGETETMRHRHAEHYESYSRALLEESRGPNQARAWRKLGAENDNLLAALAHALDSDNVDLAFRLLTSRRGAPDEWILQPLPVDALAMAGAAGHPLYPRALATAAHFAVERGDLSAAEQLAEEAVAAAEGTPSPDPFVECLRDFVGMRAAGFAGDIETTIKLAERNVGIYRSAGLEYELGLSLGALAPALAMIGEADRASPIADEALALARQVGVPTLIARNLLAPAAAVALRDPERAKALLRESVRTGAALGYPDIGLLAQTVHIAAFVPDWEQVLASAPAAIRGLHWLGSSPSVAGQFNIVARALAPTDPETAAVLQGAAARLLGAFRPPQTASAGGGTAPNAESPAGGRATGGGGGLIADLRRETTRMVRASLDEERLQELRAAGEAMDSDQVVALALAAIARARTETHS
jgi:predicted ATPase